MQVIKTNVKEAIRQIHSGDHVFIHSVAAAPQTLIKGLVNRADELSDITIYQMHTEGDAPYADPVYADSFKIRVFFVSSNVRNAIQTGRASYIPVFLSEVPILLRRKVIPIDVALISVSPPDRHGFCSLGVSVDISKAAAESARTVIAQVNKHVPRTHGDSLIHIDDIDYLVHCNEHLPEIKAPDLDGHFKKIGENVASLIEDGATIQTGIGKIPDAVLPCLTGHKDLGVHTEIFSDGIIPLVEKGVITGRYKKKHRGRIITSFVLGSRKLYDFVDDNPLVELLESDYVNDTHVIRQNPKMVAINSAIEVDITGQVCADSIGKQIFSGVGGQMDFIRGASLSEGGRPVIALPSVTKTGESRIVTFLKEGAGVVTTRAHVHYIVTEWGVANLYGKTLKQRAHAMINISHPDHREALERDIHHLY